jgi:glycosyltransferase involved in cell wall biosynthesis
VPSVHVGGRLPSAPPQEAFSHPSGSTSTIGTMRILHVNKFLYRRGGAEAYMEDVAALQVADGHEVEFFGMAHPENAPSRFSATFPAYMELEPQPRTLTGKLRATGRVLWSTSSRRGIAEVVDTFQPHVVHLHNVYHQLSPSILAPLAERGVPAVMTLHDYKLACPSYQLLDHGALCEACVGGHFGSAVRRRCKGDSLTASALAAFELWVHTAAGAYDPVGRFICPSQFLAGKMAQAGVYPERLRHVPHFVDCSIAAKRQPGGPVVFAGRLAPEKGVDTLVEAAGRAGLPVEIAGDGPERERLVDLAAQQAGGLVRFHGRLSKSAVADLVRSASVVAVPSRWFENQPMTVLEAFAAGVPVVASNLGGLSELIEPGVDGDLVPPDDADALAVALSGFLRRPQVALAMGANARAKARREFDPARHLTRLTTIYEEATMTAGARV